MIKNFQELVSQIKSQVPIQELISEYITVKKSGRGYVAVCPFHDDHHPSLQIHPQKGIFKCFACGTGGDLITFYSLINKKKWAETIPELAAKYGLKVEYGNENKAEIEIKTQLLDLNREVLNFFKLNLFHSLGEDALIYLQNVRKLTKETIEKYEIGLAQNSWDSLFNFLAKEKIYPQELLIASGLFIPRENQQGYYDRFRNRIIFPIYNENNKIAGFGGRIFPHSNDKEAKYINSPETLVFNKGQLLYGLNFAKDEIRKSDCVILTEGYLDVITAHQHGLLNTVATLGTALSSLQLRLLTKYTDSKKVCLCLDSDLAGYKALESIFRLLQDVSQYLSADLRVTANLGAKDLDEALREIDINELKNKINNGQKLIHFIFDRILNEYNTSTNDINKKESFDQLIEILITTRDPLDQLENIKYISHKVQIDEEIINFKVKEKKRLIRQKKARFEPSKVSQTDDAFKMHTEERFKHAELELLSLYISLFPHIEEIKSELFSIEFIDEKTKLIKEFLDNIENIENTKNNYQPQEVIDKLMLEFNEYKHIMSVITDIALRIETDELNYTKNKNKILKEAKEWINWWVTNKQKLKSLTYKLKECKDGNEENSILSEMITLIKNKTA